MRTKKSKYLVTVRYTGLGTKGMKYIFVKKEDTKAGAEDRARINRRNFRELKTRLSKQGIKFRYKIEIKKI